MARRNSDRIWTRAIRLECFRAAPDEAERLVAAQTIAGEDERLKRGLQEIRPAFYLETVAAKMGRFVDIDAPFAAPAAAEKLSVEDRKHLPRFAKAAEHEDPATIKGVLAAIIPYYLIEEIEIDGDEYYRFPHIHCHFSLKKQPDKSIEFYAERQEEGFPKPYFVQVGEFKKIAKLSRKAGIKHV